MGIRIGTIDTLLMKNNIVIMDSSNGAGSEVLHFDGIGGLNAITFKDIDYNHYNRPLSTVSVQIGDGGTPKTWTQWQQMGYDTHSNITPIIFANKYGNEISDYIQNAHDTGVDLSSYFIFDILGISRPQGNAWDVGAIEQ